MPSCAEENKPLPFKITGTDPTEVLFQRRCANFIYVVPQGLRELMSDISREVLRNHPENLYVFIADYLHTLMVTRENAKVAMRLIEDVGDTGEFVADFMKNTLLTRHQIDKSVRIIQRTFRRLVKKRKYVATTVIQVTAAAKMMERLKVTLEEANKAATVIQNAYRLFKLNKERRESIHKDSELNLRFRHIDWQIAAQRTFDVFTHIRGVRMSEYQQAAVRIQAAYRGYYTRKFIKDYSIFRKKIDADAELYIDDDIVKRVKNAAARVLQKFFRDIVKRNQMERIKKAESHSHESEEFIVDPDVLHELEVMQVHRISTENEDVVIIHAATSKDFAEARDKCARIIQRFFKSILKKKRGITKTHKSVDFETIELDDKGELEDEYEYEFDSDIEELFAESDNN